MPDRFVLDKDDIDYILSSVKKHWNRDDMNSIENAGYVSAIVTMQGLLKLPLVTINTLKNIYFSIQEAARQLDTLNSLKISWEEAIEKNLDPKIIKSFQQLYETQYQKVGSGKAFEG